MKRVGSYINPITGEEDWVEPETIPNILLIPQRVTRVGDTFETPIDFKMSYIESEEVINFYAEYNIGARTYRSNSHSINVEEIANEIALIVYANKTLDDSDLIKEAKRITMQNLTEKLFNENIVLSDFEVKGLGFIYLQNQKAMLFETAGLKADGKDKVLVIKDCIGSVSLENLDNPRIIFNTGNHEIEFMFNSVRTSQEGRIKTYEVNISDLIVKPKMEIIKLKEIKDEDELIKDRMQLLDSFVETDDDFDDRFGDFFD